MTQCSKQAADHCRRTHAGRQFVLGFRAARAGAIVERLEPVTAPRGGVIPGEWRP